MHIYIIIFCFHTIIKWESQVYKKYFPVFFNIISFCLICCGNVQTFLRVELFILFKFLNDKRNVARFELTWTEPETTNPSDDPDYLAAFCRVFTEKMRWLIRQSYAQTRSAACNSQIVEIMQHLTTAKALSRMFRGREDILFRIGSYLRCNGNDRPMVLHGESGSGKTSVIAKVLISLICQWFLWSFELLMGVIPLFQSVAYLALGPLGSCPPCQNIIKFN